MSDKIPYSFKFGNGENVGHITPKQARAIEAIIDGRYGGVIDEYAAGQNAFPRRSSGDGGMTLRDYFAAKALEGQLSFSPRDSFEKANAPEDVARVCYRMADAMLRERAK